MCKDTIIFLRSKKNFSGGDFVIFFPADFADFAENREKNLRYQRYQRENYFLFFFPQISQISQKIMVIERLRTFSISLPEPEISFAVTKINAVLSRALDT